MNLEWHLSVLSNLTKPWTQFNGNRAWKKEEGFGYQQATSDTNINCRRLPVFCAVVTPNALVRHSASLQPYLL
jgi:hypothetical protein